MPTPRCWWSSVSQTNGLGTTSCGWRAASSAAAVQRRAANANAGVPATRSPRPSQRHPEVRQTDGPRVLGPHVDVEDQRVAGGRPPERGGQSRVLAGGRGADHGLDAVGGDGAVTRSTRWCSRSRPIARQVFSAGTDAKARSLSIGARHRECRGEPAVSVAPDERAAIAAELAEPARQEDQLQPPAFGRPGRLVARRA